MNTAKQYIVPYRMLRIHTYMASTFLQRQSIHVWCTPYTTKVQTAVVHEVLLSYIMQIPVRITAVSVHTRVTENLRHSLLLRTAYIWAVICMYEKVSDVRTDRRHQECVYRLGSFTCRLGEVFTIISYRNCKQTYTTAGYIYMCVYCCTW